MDRLPRELIDKVCSFLPQDDLKNVLTLTNKFRYAAERFSGAFAEYTIDESNSETFVALYSGRRLPYLREVSFKPTFSPIFYHYDREMSCRENKAEVRKKDESFTRQINFLFATLQSIEGKPGQSTNLGRYRLSIYAPTREVDVRAINGNCLHYHYISWRVHLLDPDTLPYIASVRSFAIHNQDRPDYDHPGRQESKLDLRVMIDVATRFPNLEYLGVETGGFEWHSKYADDDPQDHYEHDWEGPRRDTRHGLAESIRSFIVQLPSSLKRASLDFMNPLLRVIDIDHAQDLPNLVGPADKDPFSSSLCIMSQNLRELRLRAVLDESLFWPDNDASSFGPNLEVLEIMFHMARPDGQWYFHGPGGEGREAAGFEITNEHYPPFETSDIDTKMDYLQEENEFRCKEHNASQFRVTPNEVTLRPLLEGFAMAAAQMHRLKEALIWTPLSWDPNDEDDSGTDFGEYDIHLGSDQAWGIVYVAPGQPMYRESGLSHTREIWWLATRWEPDATLHERFREIGRAEHGSELRELWYHELCDSAIVWRDSFFEEFMFPDDPGRVLSPS